MHKANKVIILFIGFTFVLYYCLFINAVMKLYAKVSFSAYCTKFRETTPIYTPFVSPQMARKASGDRPMVPLTPPWAKGLPPILNPRAPRKLSP